MNSAIWIALLSLRIVLQPAVGNTLEEQAMSDFMLTSPAFKHNAYIPMRYSCQGEDINPELEIFHIPEGTRTLALIMDDPDAPKGTWDHP